MKLELKKIKVAEHLSEETTAFSAELFADGKLIAYVSNSGQGGAHSIYPAGNRKVLEEVENYCKTLPSVQIDKFTIESNVEVIVDNLLNEFLAAKDKIKFQKKLEKLQLQNIILGNDDEYVCYKLNTPISIIAPLERGKHRLKLTLIELVKKAKEQQRFKKEFRILNTNIPQDLMPVINLV